MRILYFFEERQSHTDRTIIWIMLETLSKIIYNPSRYVYQDEDKKMKEALCVILMGSGSDSEHAQKIADELEVFGIKYVVRVGSAHKTPAHVMQLLATYEAMDCPKVYITIAGRSNALSGFVDGAVLSPTIACPPKSESFAGADIYSSLRMPSGIACAVICEPKNAALFVAKTFAQFDAALKAKVKAYEEQNAQKVLDADKTVQHK